MEEYCEGGDLNRLMSSSGEILKDAQIQKAFAQLVTAVEQCHSLEYIHRDLKPENVLLTKRDPRAPNVLVLKLADFGFATALNDFDPSIRCGSPLYMAPEVCVVFCFCFCFC